VERFVRIWQRTYCQKAQFRWQETGRFLSIFCITFFSFLFLLRYNVQFEINGVIYRLHLLFTVSFLLFAEAANVLYIINVL